VNYEGFINLVDIVFLVIILVCGFDEVRLVNGVRNPIRATAFGFITLGAFGWISADIYGATLHWYMILLHGGFAVAAMILARTHYARRRSTDNPFRHPIQRQWRNRK